MTLMIKYLIQNWHHT